MRNRNVRAAVIDSYGAPDVLHLATLPFPEPGPREVVIRTRFAGVNPIDCKTRAGYGIPVDRFPAVLGWDLAGTVVQLGTDVGRWREGDEVFGMLRFPKHAGTYQEYVVAPESELAAKPERTNFREAAGCAMVALTAWQSLFELASLKSGQRVLVHGAAGGVGHVAVQIARSTGAEVIGTASMRNADFVAGLGARAVVDYTSVPLEDVARDVDVVLDTRGGTDFLRLLETLRAGGVIVSLVGANPEGERVARAKGLRAAFTFVHPEQQALDRIAGQMSDGMLRVAIDRVFPLDEAGNAHAYVEGGHVRGRVLLEVND
jgi:NADPH:quinone reductase-like Zn-dependent oxidoreductase